jgi:exonuclease III
MTMIRCLFWNVKGLRKKGLASYVRDLMNEKSIDFVCFQETILQEFLDSCLRMIDPSRDYLWDWIPAVGKSGGVLSCIRSERFDVGSRMQGNYVLVHRPWDKKMEIKWTLFNVYGAAHASWGRVFD